VFVDDSKRRKIRGRIWGPDRDRRKTPRLGLPSAPRRSGADAGKTTDDAPEILMTGVCELIDGCVGPGEPDHYFKLRLSESGTFTTTLTTESSVAGLHIFRATQELGSGEVLASCSTLLNNPATITVELEAQVYFVRVLHFFYENNTYNLSLTFQRSRASNGKGLDPFPSGTTRQSRRRRIRQHLSTRRSVCLG
jgi:hypothetical protein